LCGSQVSDPETIIHLGDLLDPTTALAITGFAVMVTLVQLNFKGAVLVGIVLITGLSWAVGESPVPDRWIDLPTLQGTVFAFEWKTIGENWRVVLEATISFTLVCIFDTAGVQYALGTSAGLTDEDGALPGSLSAFLSSGIGTIVGACLGTSPVIIHNETAAGIIDGIETHSAFYSHSHSHSHRPTLTNSNS
jgi:adenine/guanine/hypoxanthine permease